jgi:hypothetical protein
LHHLLRRLLLPLLLLRLVATRKAEQRLLAALLEPRRLPSLTQPRRTSNMADYQLLPTGDGFMPPGVLRKTDGAFVPDDPGNRDWQTYQAWLAVPNTPDPVPAAPRPSVISVQAFWARFTPTEQGAIQAAASTNPAIAQAMTFALVVGQVNLLTGPIVTSWMAALVAAGVITSARSAIILTP